MSDPLSLDDFLKVDVRIGTVVSARLNEKARKPAYVLEVDFGDLGVKTTSAQITENYTTDDLIGRQVAAVINFPAKVVAGVRSEVLILAAICPTQGTVLLQPASGVENGVRVA